MAASEILIRRAALLLHAQPIETRRRLVDQLSTDEAATLRPLLDELEQLGIPPEFADLRQIAAAAPEIYRAPIDAPPAERLNWLSAESIAHAIQQCSAPTIVQLLSGGHWPWKHAVLEHLSEPKRSEVRRCLQREVTLLADAAYAALSERLCTEVSKMSDVQRMPDAKAGVSSRRGMSRWKRWLKWMR